LVIGIKMKLLTNRTILKLAIAQLVIGVCIWMTMHPTTLAQEYGVELRLDFRPFTDPTSTFVHLHGNGRISVVHYLHNRLYVVAIYKGILQEGTLSQLLTKTQKPTFYKALRQKHFSGIGLSRGDQFYLSFQAQGDTTEECFGFVEDAPEVIRSIIKDLLSQDKQLGKTSLAEAYMRSKPIAKERLEKLRRAGQIRFMPLHEFPRDLQMILISAISGPLGFYALSLSDYNQLLMRGREFFIIDNNFGYQLNLFLSQ